MRLGTGPTRCWPTLPTAATSSSQPCWFHAWVTDRLRDGVVTEVVGQAFRTGEHRFVLDPRDPVGTGFVLR